MNIVTIHHILNDDFDEEWFFSTDHCQPRLNTSYVSVTHYNTTVDEVREKNNGVVIIGSTVREIPNPNPAYQPNY